MSSTNKTGDIKKGQILTAIKTLKESSNVQEKCEALSCVQSALTMKSGAQDMLVESQSKELCKLVINALINGNKILYREANTTLVIILKLYKDRNLNLFHELMKIDYENRLKIFQLFEGLRDDVINDVSRDSFIVEYLKDCLKSITVEKMNWLSPESCIEDIKTLRDIEEKNLSTTEQIEEKIIVCIFNLIYRLYKISSSTTYAECTKFDVLFVDKISTLAYMGHKRQRALALKILQLPNIGNHIRNSSPNIWQEYKTKLQNIYCQRMNVLVGACESDWSLLWSVSIQLLGTDLHRGAGLINNLLNVEEKAFKSVDNVVRRQAFLSWKIIVDNFALDEQELATARRVKLLCIPLNAKNSKTESMTLTKLEVWWHLINRLYKHIKKFSNPVLTQFLNFCFGPLGDTPLLSSKFNVIASPGKRFPKTKLVAIDALLQLLTDNVDDLNTVNSCLQEKIPAPLTNDVFQDCFKPFVHSVGEACLAIAQLAPKDTEIKSPIITVLWKTIITRVKGTEDESIKVQMYKEIMLLVVELSEHAESKPVIRDALLDVILPTVDNFPPNYIFQFETIAGLMNVVTKSAILNKIIKKHHDLIKRLLWRGVKPPHLLASYVPNALEVFKNLVTQLISTNPQGENLKGLTIVWCILSEMMIKYITDGQNINEGDAAAHDFNTVQSLIKFPFGKQFAHEFWQQKKVAANWKTLYKQFDLQASLVPTVKPNEFVSFAVSVIQDGIKCDRRCGGFAVTCLDGILTTMNYKHVLEENGFLPIVGLMNDLCILNLTDGKSKDAEAALRELSSVLITLYGHAPTKVASCLEAVRPAIEHMLKPCKDESLIREIASTWETIMSIFKGLGTLLAPDIIVSFQNAIRLALSHSEPEIVSQTLSCLEKEEYMNGATKDLVKTFMKEVDLDKLDKGQEIPVPNDLPEGYQQQSKSTKFPGSFLNRRTASPKPVTPTQKPKADRKSPYFPDPDSQEYVVIKSDFKFDASRLTEHQKESLLRRREDIPALYNDLSQSCSQDTQNIQRWFDKKKDEINQALTQNSVNNSSISQESEASALPPPPPPPSLSTDHQNIDVSEANKENKLDSEAADSEASSLAKDKTKSKEGGAEQSDVNKQNLGENEVSEVEETHENLSPDDAISRTINDAENSEPITSVAKKLDFESRTEFPDDGESSIQKTVEAVPSTSRNSEPEIEEKIEKLGETETLPKETKRGLKRKTTDLDSDSDGNIVPSRRRRKTLPSVSTQEGQSDSDSLKSIENEEVKQVSRRTKKEMTRLQINMVFDNKQFAILPSRRRSKINNEDDHDAGNNEDREASETTKLTRQRTQRSLPLETSKGGKKTEEKEEPKIIRKRGRPRIHPQVEQSPGNIPPEVPAIRNVNLNSKEAIKTTSDQKISKIKTTKEKSSESKDGKEASPPAKEKEVITEDTNSAENNLQMPALRECNDSEEVVESSQASSPGSTSTDKKYDNKQCYIRINKIKTVQPGQSVEQQTGPELRKSSRGSKPNSPSEVGADQISEIVENISQEISQDGKTNSENEKSGEIEEKTASCSQSKESKSDSVAATTVDVTEDTAIINIEEDVSVVEPRPQVTDASSTPVVIPILSLNTSSPKNSTKRYSKLKSVAPQGRAAHMLGLVTKQAKADARAEIFIENDNSPSKKKAKESEDDNITAGKKERLYSIREPDRLGSPSGSRQEKIFNNMRTAPENEATASTSSSLFGKLKNDGEKSSPVNKNSENITAATQSEKTKEKTSDDNTLPIKEKETLPMLEWSSANPPSLTASPSASILKRQRQQLQIENDVESPTACKRKRVSFADPPVSKEMGYEISASTPAHRMSKVSGSRALLLRKDTPTRMKQTKLILLSPGKSNKETEVIIDKSCTDDTDSELTRTITTEDTTVQITEDSDDSPVIIYPESEKQSSDIINDEKTNPSRQVSRVNDSAKIMIDNLSMEVEIASGSRDHGPRDKDVITTKELNKIAKPRNDKTDETQQDIFEITEIIPHSFKSPIKNTKVITKGKIISPDEQSLRCVDISVLTNSMENRSQSSMEVLEDTIDIQNITGGLNFNTNSDEISHSKPVRTSTATTEADTITVTDSVFASLPNSQGTQSTNDTMELDQPELLDSTRSIYPSLTDSSAPIDAMIQYLVDPIWKPHLSSYLHAKGIDTVGDLAQLSEREVNWIPVKGSPRIPFVKSVLHHFETSSVNLPFTASTVDASHESGTTTPNESMTSLLPTSTPIARSSSLSETTEQSSNVGNLLNESFERTEQPTKATQTIPVEQLVDDIDPTVVLKSAMRRCSPDSILAHYKKKMRYVAEKDLERETLRMLGFELQNYSENHLKSVCRAAGLTKVLGRLPDIFSHDKQFFGKVLMTYRRKIKVSDCIHGLDFEEIKSAVCQLCTSSELAEMLSNQLKAEEEAGVATPMTELSSLQAMLKRMPKDLIISHTVANEELISPLVVLDIALQNNNPTDIAMALEGQPSNVKNRVFEALCTNEALSMQIKEQNFSDDIMTDMLKTISKKLDASKLLDTFHVIMKDKFLQQEEK